MVINFRVIFPFLFAFIFLLIFISWNGLFNEVYGHSLSKDESLPFDIAGKQKAIEGIMEPSFLNEGNQMLSFVVRTHDEKTNVTIKDINNRIIAKFKNETILDQRFHSLDGFIIANLIPSNNSNIDEIISKDKVIKHLSKNDLVKVSSKNQLHSKAKYLLMVAYIIYQ